LPKQWTDEQRAEQAERCRAIQPWQYSTGPRTKRGKKRSSMNAKKPASAGLYLALLEAGDYRLARLVFRRIFRPSRSAR